MSRNRHSRKNQPQQTKRKKNMSTTNRPVPFPPLPRFPIPFPNPILFKPKGKIVKQSDGVFDLTAEVLVPNRCFSAAAVELGLPPGSSYAPTTHTHALLHVTYSGGIDRLCAMEAHTLNYFGDDLKIGTGKDTLYLHTVLENRVILGTTKLDLPTQIDILSTFGIFPWPDVDGLIIPPLSEE